MSDELPEIDLGTIFDALREKQARGLLQGGLAALRLAQKLRADLDPHILKVASLKDAKVHDWAAAGSSTEIESRDAAVERAYAQIGKSVVEWLKGMDNEG